MTRTFSLAVALLASQLLIGGSTGAIVGQLVDAKTNQPPAEAIATLGSATARTDQDGWFAIVGSSKRLGARAYGHGLIWVPIPRLKAEGGASPCHQ